MARKANKRKIGVRILLTNKAFQMVESAAFKNCRTVSQELTYMVERQLVEKPKVKEMARYDEQPDATPMQSSDNGQAITSDTNAHEQETSMWSPEDEALVSEKCKAIGMTDGQIMAAKLIYKTPEKLLESLTEKDTA